MAEMTGKKFKESFIKYHGSVKYCYTDKIFSPLTFSQLVNDLVQQFHFHLNLNNFQTWCFVSSSWFLD